jgi:hypothetical protein
MGILIKYITEDNQIGYLLPNLNCELSLEQIAEKDSPPGATWTITDTNDDDYKRMKAERQVRSERVLRLEEIDPIVTNPLRWDDLSESQRQAVIDYRRSLLDITDQPGFPFAVTWPEKPQL